MSGEELKEPVQTSAVQPAQPVEPFEPVATTVPAKPSGGVTGEWESAQPEEDKKRKKRALLWIILLVLALAAGAFAALFFGVVGNAPWYDGEAGNGTAGLSDEDIQALLNAKVEEGMMNVTVLSPMEFPDGTTNPGLIGFNNLEQNHFDQKLVITLDETGEVLYESGAIAPGQNIAYVELNRDLPPGEHAATARVTGFDRETHEEMGALEAAVTIAVGG